MLFRTPSEDLHIVAKFHLEFSRFRECGCFANCQKMKTLILVKVSVNYFVILHVIHQRKSDTIFLSLDQIQKSLESIHACVNWIIQAICYYTFLMKLLETLYRL